MFNFCTLFDSNYLSRGLTMYESLVKHEKDFHLYIIAFDEKCLDILSRLLLEKATIISLEEFEDKELLRVKPNRTRAEYCWTATSSTILYCLQKYNLPNCTYLDADLFFYASPRVLFEEISSSSICITEHRYSPKYNKAVKAGKYCVQFVYFKNDKNGLQALKWWREACIDWCFNRHEDGKFGDQKYLDEFSVRFENVHDLQYLGGGVAPWNVQQYDFFEKNNHIVAKDSKKNTTFELIFYHFHYFRFLKNGYVDLGRYPLTKNDIELIYKPYLHALQDAKNKIQQIDTELNPHGQVKLTAWKRLTRFLAMDFKWDVNIYKIKNFG